MNLYHTMEPKADVHHYFSDSFFISLCSTGFINLINNYTNNHLAIECLHHISWLSPPTVIFQKSRGKVIFNINFFALLVCGWKPQFGFNSVAQTNPFWKLVGLKWNEGFGHTGVKKYPDFTALVNGTGDRACRKGSFRPHCPADARSSVFQTGQNWQFVVYKAAIARKRDCKPQKFSHTVTKGVVEGLHSTLGLPTSHCSCRCSLLMVLQCSSSIPFIQQFLEVYYFS